MGTHFGTTLLRYVQYSIFQQNVPLDNKKSTPRVMAERERGDKDVLA